MISTTKLFDAMRLAEASYAYFEGNFTDAGFLAALTNPAAQQGTFTPTSAQAVVDSWRTDLGLWA